MEVHIEVHIPERSRSDKEMLRDRLIHFFPDDESDKAKQKIDSAEARFMLAVEHSDVSPYAAFKEVIRTTALAQEMDTLHASLGGIDFYIMDSFPRFEIRADEPEIKRGERLSEKSQIEARNAAMRRKVQEIKKLMANNKTGDVNGTQAVKEPHDTNRDAQGQEDKTEQS